MTMGMMPGPGIGATGTPGTSGVSLLHFDGPNNSTIITDVYGLTWTRPSSAAYISTTEYMFGGSSLYVNGDGIVCSSGVFNIGTGDFTVEGWLWSPGFTGGDGYYTVFRATASGTALYVHGGDLVWYESGALITSGSVSTSAWHAFAVTRKSGTVYLFLDGMLIGSHSSTANFNGTFTAAYGINSNGNIEAFPGYLDECRFSNFCRYTASYTPSGPFSS